MPPAITQSEARTAIVVPVRYAAWLSGDIGRTIEASLKRHLVGLRDVEATRLPRGILVSTSTAAGAALESVERAVRIVEDEVARAFPVLHHDLGPLWTGTLQVVYPVS